MRWDNQSLDTVDRWKPFGLVIGVLVTGLFLGLVIGLQSCAPSNVLTGAKEESYLALASTLYSQGESIEAMKVYLNSLGSHEPSVAILQLADKYERSDDRKKQQQSRDLRQLGDALRIGREPAAPREVAESTATPAPVLPTPPSTATAARPSEPVTQTQSTQTPAKPTPVPTPITAVPPAAATLPSKGVARPASGGGAILRTQPSTKSEWAGSLSNGAEVDIVKIVEGEAVDPAEPRWYLVKYQNLSGYVYFKLIAPKE